ncbi:urokinase plasminogen activator surface receptor-like isoform X2 [Betta splendens]|uniref:Urokinase plasminogen activator surface receptor-like isoform X2 n=1 Tax=Betta splendens TaxID=158456 RepID=A0A9W2XRW4_BETSP|nr:urokinase plasminogen activator surface receptor-like isoform X2 [Betta splendens]
MQLLLALTSIWTLLSSAGALQCLMCTDAADPTCASTASVPCDSSQCLTATVPGPLVYKACGQPVLCPSAGNQTFSLSSTALNISFNSQCCNTDNCNGATLSLPTFQSVNSLQCYSCDNYNRNCSIRIQCKGGEDRCFKTNVTNGGITLPFLGCASSNLCTAASNLSSIAPIPGLSCCQGSLCNSAPATATTAHLLLVLLLFSLYH